MSHMCTNVEQSPLLCVLAPIAFLYYICTEHGKRAYRNLICPTVRVKNVVVMLIAFLTTFHYNVSRTTLPADCIALMAPMSNFCAIDCHPDGHTRCRTLSCRKYSFVCASP